MIDEVQKLRFEVTKLRTELDRIKSSYRVQVRDLANERDTFRGEVAPLKREIDQLVAERIEMQKRMDLTDTRLVNAQAAVSFFASVIKCREPWTAACEVAYNKVFPL